MHFNFSQIKNAFTPSAAETRKYWRHLILCPAQGRHGWDADQHQTMGPVGDNNMADHTEAGVVGIIMLLQFCFDIWIITGSQQQK